METQFAEIASTVADLNQPFPETQLTKLDKAIAENPRNFEAYFKRANLHREQGNTEKALEDYGKALQIFPNSSTVYCLRGFLIQGMGDEQWAINDYNEAIRLNAANGEAFKKRGLLYLSMADNTKALIDLSKAITLNPSDSELYSARAAVYMNLDLPSKAIGDYTQVILLEPSNFEAFFQRGKLNHSITDLDMAIQLNPNCASAYLARANVQIDSQKYLAYLNMALQLDQLNLDALLARATVVDSACRVQDCTKVLSMDPANLKAYTLRAELLYDSKQYESAIEDINKALTLDPQDYKLHRLKGFCLQCLDQLKVAVKSLLESERLLKELVVKAETDQDDQLQQELRELSSSLRIQIQRIQKQLMEPAVMVREYSKAIELEPSNASLYMVRASAYASLKNLEMALQDINRSIQMNPTGVSYFVLGTIREEMECYEEAFESYSKVLELHPQLAEYCDIYKRRGKALIRMMRYEEAVQNYSEAIALGITVPIFLIIRATLLIVLNGKESDKVRSQRYIEDLGRAKQMAHCLPYLQEIINQTLSMLDENELLVGSSMPLDGKLYEIALGICLQSLFYLSMLRLSDDDMQEIVQRRKLQIRELMQKWNAQEEAASQRGGLKPISHSEGTIHQEATVANEHGTQEISQANRQTEVPGLSCQVLQPVPLAIRAATDQSSPAHENIESGRRINSRSSRQLTQPKGEERRQEVIEEYKDLEDHSDISSIQLTEWKLNRPPATPWLTSKSPNISKFSRPPEGLVFLKNLTENPNENDEVYLALYDDKPTLQGSMQRQWMVIHRKDNLFEIRNVCLREWLAVEQGRLKASNQRDYLWRIQAGKNSSELAWTISPADYPHECLTYSWVKGCWCFTNSRRDPDILPFAACRSNSFLWSIQQ